MPIGRSLETGPHIPQTERLRAASRTRKVFYHVPQFFLSTVLVASFCGVALADGGDTDIEQFIATQPHGAGISNGTPVIVDNQEGQPVIRYEQGGDGGFALAEVHNPLSPVQVN